MNLPRLINDIPAGGWLLWVGAGVSYPAPAALPLGIPLTSFALRECCGEMVAARVRQLWDEANGIVGTPSNPAPLGPMPRLESVLGDIDDVRAKSARPGFDFLQGFSAFAAAPFNQNHLCIAEMLTRGVNVVTTNFDTCIEQAYRWFTGGSDELILDAEFATPCYRSRGNAAAGRVWHVHGTAQDVRSLGATIRAVKEGLPGAFRDWLDGVLSGSALIIFLGYGAGDSFDVNLYFAGQPEAHFPASAAWFVQHPGAPPPAGAELLLNPFGRRLITTEDTSSVLRTLTHAGHAPAPAAPFPWAEAFLRHAVMTGRGEIRGYLICKLAFTLGVNVDLLDETAYAAALLLEPQIEPDDFHRTLAYVCRVQGRAEQERRHDLLSKRGGTEMLGYHYSKGHLRRALRYAKSVEALLDDARAAGVELDWRTYTSMSAHCRSAMTKYLINPFVTEVTGGDRVKVERLFALTAQLSEMPLRNVRYINQVATALRFNFLLKALLSGVRDVQTVERVLRLYGEGASVAGFISTYRDVAIMHFFLDKFHHAGALHEAMVYINKSRRLAETVGDVPSIKRAKKLSAYFNFYSSVRRSARLFTKLFHHEP